MGDAKNQKGAYAKASVPFYFINIVLMAVS